MKGRELLCQTLRLKDATPNARLPPYVLQDLVCEPLCPVPTPPIPLGTCTQSLFAEGFANSTSAAARFTSVVALQPIGTAWQFVDGDVQATGAPGCITSGLVMVATSASVQSYTGIFNVSTTLQTDFSAGLVFFAAPDGSSYYALTLNATAGVLSIQVGYPGPRVHLDGSPNLPTTSLQLWNAYTLTTLASAPFRVLGGPSPWYTILLQYFPGNILSGYVNGEKLVTVSDLTLSGGGYPGLYATYSATFSSLAVNVPCSVGTCSPTTVQGVCQFTCPTGYVASSNGTLVCTMAPTTTSAFWTGPSLSCTLPPPVFYGAYISTPGWWL